MERKKTNNRSWGRLCRALLFVLFAGFIAFGSVSTLTVTETQAASQKSYKKIKLKDKSGRYIVDTGHNWWLKDKKGKKVTGLQYIKMPSGNKLKSGYYMFNERGCLCKKKDFHTVNTVIGSRTFKGTFYFGGSNGSLYRKAGWKTIKRKEIHAFFMGKAV